MKTFYTVVLCLITTLVLGQQTNVWRFGNGAGLDFNSGSPVALTASPMNTNEAAASICDNQGQLLFYTNGITVWNRNNVIMANGSGLLGGTSSTQTLIVQRPGTCSQYYIFSTGDDITGNIGGHYSIVDMCLNGGLGDIIIASKNTLFSNNCSEKLTAVKHSNGTDIWIITHELGNANFRTYLLTASGLGSAIVQSIGSIHSSNCMIGFMKASHNGQKLVSATTFNCTDLNMFDFNSTTGALSAYVNLGSIIGSNWYYGIEFSPNDQLLYLSDCYVSSSLTQVNLSNYATTVLATNGSNYAFGALQLAPDGKIYMGRTNQTYISAVNFPNVVGSGCGYVSTAVTLGAGTTSGLGLINFVPWYMTSSAPQFVALGNDTTLSCASSLVLAPPSTCNATYLWSNATSNPTLTVSSPGTYWVEIVNTCGSDRDSIVISGVSGNATAQFTTTGPTLCGLPITFNNTSIGATTYLWNFGDNTTSSLTNPTHVYGSTGTYQVMLIASGACGTDTTYSLLVIDPSNSNAQFTSSGSVCGSPVVFANASSNSTTYFWDFGDNTTSAATNPTHTYSAVGTYQIMLIASNVCSTDTTFALITITGGTVTAGFTSVSSACMGNPVFFSNGSSGASSYAWDFGDSGTSNATSPAHTYTTSGTFTVTLIASGTCTNDTITHTVQINPIPQAAIAGLDTICVGQTITLTASGGGSYQWSGGSTAATSSISVSPATTTTYYVVVSLGSCVSVPDTHVVTVMTPSAATISGPTTLCIGQTVTLIASGGASYQWSGGSSATTSSIAVSPTTTTTYYVTPIYGVCVGTPDTHIVTVVPVPVVNASGNTTICIGQSTTLTASGGTSYQWSGGSTDTTAAIVVSPSATTTYFVTTTNGICSSGFDTITVTVLPAPTVNIVGAQNVCPGTTINLTAVGTATTYVWGGAATGTGSTISDVPTGISNYYVIGYNSQGCSDTDMVTITVYDAPSVAILGNDTICIGESTALTCTGNGTFNWSPSTGLSSTTTQNVVASPTTTITYTTQIVDINGCPGSDTFQLVVEPCTGINPIEVSEVSIYPNPANSYVDINIAQTGEWILCIYDINGQIVSRQESNFTGTTRVDLELLSDGVYVVIVYQNGISFSEKLVHTSE